ncbi:unnamed protein product [Pleuronectes platessa]|uniref:Uncharacterized protein n=1 Tax=Pleuronectes platessa TaxID=8262 RepID=A0A9N7VK61_PLEPL|nr:unnamed protein product [Pleuronectes platessa]
MVGGFKTRNAAVKCHQRKSEPRLSSRKPPSICCPLHQECILGRMPGERWHINNRVTIGPRPSSTPPSTAHSDSSCRTFGFPEYVSSELTKAGGWWLGRECGDTAVSRAYTSRLNMGPPHICSGLAPASAREAARVATASETSTTIIEAPAFPSF